MLAILAVLTLAVSPDPVLTPGALNAAVTQDSLAQTVCKAGWTKTIRPPGAYTNALKRRQLAALGLAISPRRVEEDHRVPLELGGAPRDERNLWPQPWAGPLGAHAKDRLENAVHNDLCIGRLNLQQARAIFLADWTVTYRLWFGDPPAVIPVSTNPAP